MTEVTEQLDLPGPPNGTATLPGAARATLQVRLAGAGGEPVVGYANGNTIVADRDVYADPTGAWSLNLVPNSEISPSGTVYRLDYDSVLTRDAVYISVPATGSYDVSEILTAPPGAIDPSYVALLQQEIAALQAEIDVLNSPIKHRWDVDGWDVFTPVTITSDAGTDSFDTIAVTGTGIVSNPNSDSNVRVAYLREGTETFVDSEMEALFLAPPNGWGGTNVQQGLMARVREIGGGVWEGIAVWTSIVFGGTMANLHCKSVRFNGGTVLNQSGNAGEAADPSATDSAYIDRTLGIVTKERTTGFGLFFNNHACVPNHLYGIVSGDIVTIDSSDATMDETGATVNSANPSTGRVQVIEGTTLSTSALAADQGTVRPSGVSEMKRWAPFWMAVRCIGDTVYIMRWRPEEYKPSWSNPRVRRVVLAPDADVPSIASGPGANALWAAHFFDGSSGGWGDFNVVSLDA